MELNKLNRNIYALTFGPRTIPPMAQKMSKKIMRLSYKQYKRSLCNNDDMSLHSMVVGEQLPTVAEIMGSILTKYISIAANNCGYAGTAAELMVNYV